MIGPGSLYDLDEMVLRCHGPSARDYIDEVVLAYKVGAYRSSIIATWIAVYFDLVDKLRVHARSGVASASAWVEQFEAYVRDFEPGDPKSARKMLGMEAEILNKVTESEIGILTKLECEDLKRLREDRHRCAHPTFLNEVDKFSPTAERARNHIRVAIDAVLSKNAVPGSLLSARILSYCRSRYFPAESPVAEDELRAEFNSEFSDAVLGPVLDSLLDDIFEADTSPTERRQRTAAVDALYGIAEDAVAAALSRRVRELATISDPYVWWIAIGLLNHLTWAWDALEESQQSLFERVVRQVEADNAFGAGAVIEAMTTESLAAIGKSRARDLSLATLDSYTDALPVEIVKDELLSRIEASSNWRTSELLFAILMKRSELLDDDDYVISLLRYAANNDQVFAAPRFVELMNHLIINRAHVIPNEELRIGTEQVLAAMSRDHRVIRKELRTLAAAAAFLLDVDVDVKDEP